MFNKYPDKVMENVRQNLYLEEDDISKDSEIDKMSKDEVFERFLTWEGIIGYEDLIKDAIESIYGVRLNG